MRYTRVFKLKRLVIFYIKYLFLCKFKIKSLQYKVQWVETTFLVQSDALGYAITLVKTIELPFLNIEFLKVHQGTKQVYQTQIRKMWKCLFKWMFYSSWFYIISSVTIIATWFLKSTFDRKAILLISTYHFCRK